MRVSAPSNIACVGFPAPGWRSGRTSRAAPSERRQVRGRLLGGARPRGPRPGTAGLGPIVAVLSALLAGLLALGLLPLAALPTGPLRPARAPPARPRAPE